MPSPRLFFRLPAHDDAQVRALARRNGTTVSAELRRAVCEHLRSAQPSRS
jgi:hypothetical protein